MTNPAPRRDRTPEVLALFDPGAILHRDDVMKATGLAQAMTNRYLTRLVKSGDLVATAPARSPARRYKLP